MMGSWPVLVNQYSGPIFWGMELLSCLLPDSTSLHPVSWHLDPHLDPDQATAALSLISQQPAPECPLCHVAARRLHSRYERTLADLPWAGWTVRLELGVRKLFCDNPDCGRRIFTERLPGVVAPWARRTLRLGKRLTTVALGGSAGARLSRDLGIAQHAAAVDPCGAPAGLPNPDGPGRR
jgi:transposase